MSHSISSLSKLVLTVALVGVFATTHAHNTPTGDLLATIESNGTATTTSYIHTDHLGGTNVVTDENGDVTEVTDYYPFGEQRVSELYAGSGEQRKFTGHEYDAESNLTYAKQRYYAQDVGKWISMDPASRDNPSQFLADPQQLNSYSYVRNNPLVLVDPNGELALALPGAQIGSAFGPAGTLIGLGAGIVASFVLADKFHDSLKTGTLKNAGPRFENQLYPTPGDPNNLKTPKNNSPWWGKILWFVGGAGAAGYEQYKSYKEQEEFAENFNSQSEQVPDDHSQNSTGDSSKNSTGPATQDYLTQSQNNAQKGTGQEVSTVSNTKQE